MFDTLNPLSADPILGLTAAYRQDTNPHKIDLGVGVYKDEMGHTPIMAAVKLAEKVRLDSETTKSYLSPAGDPGFNQATATLLLGDAVSACRVDTVQVPGGTGGLCVAAGLIKRCNSDATVWVSNPTWANHKPVFNNAGLTVKEYPYYDLANKQICFDEMIATLQQLGANDVVLLHGCCHNPTGADLSEQQWQHVAELAQQKGFTPLIDIAYQGFGQGIDEDAYGVRLLAKSVAELMVVSSCSKNFGLYRERIGALCLISADKTTQHSALDHALNVARAIYSMPPAHGAAIVSMIMQDDKLHSLWENELTAMRERMNALRILLVDKLAEQGVSSGFDHINQQRGMFTFLGISVEQVQRLRDEFGIYMVSSSRINVAGICKNNIDYLATSIAAVL